MQPTLNYATAIAATAKAHATYLEEKTHFKKNATDFGRGQKAKSTIQMIAVATAIVAFQSLKLRVPFFTQMYLAWLEKFVHHPIFIPQ